MRIKITASINEALIVRFHARQLTYIIIQFFQPAVGQGSGPESFSSTLGEVSTQVSLALGEKSVFFPPCHTVLYLYKKGDFHNNCFLAAVCIAKLTPKVPQETP